MANLQVRFLHGERLTRRQIGSFCWTQNMICSAWEEYRLTTMTLGDVKRLLDICSHLVGHTE